MKLLIALLVITCCGCVMQGPAPSIDLNRISYYKDPTTGLCYASMSSYSYGSFVMSLTCVPCDSLKKVKVETP